MLRRFSVKEINSLKRQAKALKKQEGIKHSDALDRIAVQHGYRNWSRLQYRSLHENDGLQPAHVFSTRQLETDLELIQVAAVRYGRPEEYNSDFFGQLIFRCPKCGVIHYHGACGIWLGAGNGGRVPHCESGGDGYHFDLVEVLDPFLAGTLPGDVLQDVCPPKYPKAIEAWFKANHTAAVDISPWDSREGGYLFPTYDNPFDIQQRFRDYFECVDDELLFEIADKVFLEGPWITASFMEALDNDWRKDDLRKDRKIEDRQHIYYTDDSGLASDTILEDDFEFVI